MPGTLVEEARQVTIPLQFLLQWDDEGMERQPVLDLFDAFGTKEKTLHANLGGHAAVPWFEVDAVHLVTVLSCGRTRGVVVTHMWGHPCEMNEVTALARARGLRLVEDCSHAHGARYRGSTGGTFGDAACFSLQAKNHHRRDRRHHHQRLGML